MVQKKVVIAVDKKFFDNIFEKKRKEMQNKIGIKNLSQSNFTKLIKGFELNIPKQVPPKINKRRKKNEFAMF